VHRVDWFAVKCVFVDQNAIQNPGARMAMKVVAFNGSPRKGGNTEQMIEQA